MKNLLKIISCGALLASQTLLSVQTPNWTNPIGIYSTPNSSVVSSIPFLLANTGIKSDGNGNATLLYPTITYPSLTTLGTSAQVNATGTVTYPLNPQLIPGNQNGGSYQDVGFLRNLSVNASGNAMSVLITLNQQWTPSGLQSSYFNGTTKTWSTPTALSNILNWSHNVIYRFLPQIYLHNDNSAVAAWYEYHNYNNESDGALIRFNIFNGTNWLYNGSLSANDIDSNNGRTLAWNITSTGEMSNSPENANALLLDTPTGTLSNPKTKYVYVNKNNELKIASLNYNNSNPESSNNYGYSWQSNLLSTEVSDGNPLSGAINSSGNYIVAWVANNGKGYASYNGDTQDEDNFFCINNDITNVAQIQTLVREEDNNCIIIYSYNNVIDTYYNASGSSWLAANTASNLTAAKDAANNIYIVFQSTDSNGKGSIYYIYNNYVGPVYYDNNGNQTLYTDDPWNWYSPTWSHPIQLSPNTNDSYTNPQLSVSANGTALVSWIKNGITLEAITTTPNTYQPQMTWFECTNQQNAQC